MKTRWTSFVVGICAALLVAACATPSVAPSTAQPALSAMAQPYADELRKAGIRSVQVPGAGARVRTATDFGEIYTRYPAGLGSTVFALYVDATTIDVDSDAFNAGNASQYETAVKAILPQVIKAANENNARVITSRFGKN